MLLDGDLMARFEAEFYEKENGEQPAREFLLSLDKKTCKDDDDYRCTAGQR